MSITEVSSSEEESSDDDSDNDDDKHNHMQNKLKLHARITQKFKNSIT